MLVPVLNIGMGLFLLVILWVLSIFLIIALAAVPKAKARYLKLATIQI